MIKSSMNKPNPIQRLMMWWRMRKALKSAIGRNVGQRDMVASLLVAYGYRRATVFEHSGGILMVYVEVSPHMARFVEQLLEEKIKEVVPTGVVVTVNACEMHSYRDVRWVKEYPSYTDEQRYVVARAPKRKAPAKKTAKKKR